jgi:glycosyltransferase involved in cell wall biosynthesis
MISAMTSYSTQPVLQQGSLAATRLNLVGKRVGMVTFSPYPGDPRPRRAVDALLEQGMQVDLICLTHEGGAKHEKRGDLTVRRLPITHRRGGKFSYVFNYLAFILINMAILTARTFRCRYDLIYIHNMPDILVLCALVPKIFGSKVILDMHDPMPELMTSIYGLQEGARSVRVIRTLERWSMAFVDGVITVNRACKRIFSERSCAAGKISIVMNSPDEKIFPVWKPRLPGWTGNGRPERLVLMYHGSLVERNGLDLAVEALAQVKDAYPGIELRVYGASTPFLEQTLLDAERKGLSDRVHYLGHRKLEDLVTAINECDIGVIPNQRNAFTEINTPTRIFEYLAVGRPVIAPRTSGIEDYFNPESLLFFEPGDAADLARRIEEVALDPKRAVATAAQGQRCYLDHTWPQERQSLVNVVSGLLRPGAAH